MKTTSLGDTPFNLIITGVGGQGNVLASRVVGDIMSDLGFTVTIGETFGASQRGGSVMSHLRISSKGVLSPQIPKGKADMVVALEPIEAIRVLKNYGNPRVKVLCVTRPIQPMSVICGELTYPEEEKIVGWIRELSSASWFFDPSSEALRLGNPIVANIITVGALAATKTLPIDLPVFEKVIRRKFPQNKVDMNLKAFQLGKEMIQNQK